MASSEEDQRRKLAIIKSYFAIIESEDPNKERRMKILQSMLRNAQKDGDEIAVVFYTRWLLEL